MAKFKLPWNLQWTPDGERESAEKELGTKVDTYEVVRAQFNSDIYGEGRPEDIGLEFIVSSPEEHDSDDRLSEWERATIAEILQLNPDYEIAWDEWDREGGEEEWFSKHIFKMKPQQEQGTVGGGVVLTNEGYFKCPEYEKYAPLIKFKDDLEITDEKIVLKIKMNDCIGLPKLCSCKYGHFACDNRAYQDSLHEQMGNLRNAVGDKRLTEWLNKRNPGNIYNDDLDEVCGLGSAFFCEEGLSIKLEMSEESTIVTLS